MQLVTGRPRFLAAALVVATALAVGAAVFAATSGPKSHSSVESAGTTVTAPLAQGVGGISASQLAQRGIYLGPPGEIPAGTPAPPNIPVPTTVGANNSGSATPTTELSSERQAVQGDPANGTAKVSSNAALATAKENLGGFVGTVSWGTPVLEQLDNIYAGIVATTWVIPVTGTVELSAGPVGTSGAPVTLELVTQTALVFVDSFTGTFISEEGFSNSP
ncbi:MAG: hypothetical protein ACYCUG_08520 [Acidimicrobiales bacterium]